MSRLAYSIICAVMAVSIVQAGPAQKKAPEHGPIVPATPRNPNMKVTDMNMTMPLVAPFFIENGGYRGTITMVNELPKTVQGTVIARAPDGSVLGRKVITFAPKSQEDLRVSDLLGGPAPQRIVGSIELDPDPQEVTSMAIAAQLSIVDVRTFPATYFEEEFLMVDPEMLSQYRAVVPPTVASPRVALFSTSASPQRVDVECLSEGAQRTLDRSFRLRPHQMRLVSACAVRGRVGRPFEAAFHPVRGRPTALAISVQTNGSPGSLAVWGVSRIGKRHGTEISLNFEDAATLKTKETIFAGVPVGTADLLPGDTFTPDLAVANYGNTPSSVSVIYSTMQGDSPDSNTLATFSLPAHSVRHVSLPDLTGNPSLRNTFVVKSNTAPGTVIANLVLKGQGEYPAVQLMGKDPAVNNGGEHPWTIADGDQSTVLLFNCSDKQQIFNVMISANGTVWRQHYTVRPAETKTIDIGALVTNQIADQNGVKLPSAAKSGAISWFTADPGKGTGRLLVSNPETGLARNFSCGTNYVLCNAMMYNNITAFGWQLVGELGDVNGLTCLAYNPQACSGQSTNESGYGYSYYWTSNSPSIAPITGSNTGSSANFYGQNVGTGTGTGEVYNQYCQAQSTGTTQVNPTITVSSVTASPATISTTGSGTLTVEVAIGGVVSGTHGYTMTVSTYQASPTCETLSYHQPSQNGTVSSSSVSPEHFTVPFASGSTAPGSVTAQAVLQSSDPGLNIVPSNPVSDSRATVTITQ